MSPRVIAIIVAIVLVIVVGMVLTVKRSASKHRAQQVELLHRGQTTNRTDLVRDAHANPVRLVV